MDWLIVIASVCVAILYLLIGVFFQVLLCGEYDWTDEDGFERMLIIAFWPLVFAGLLLVGLYKVLTYVPTVLALKIREWVKL